MKLDYFAKIDTYRKAYFLGFIQGDGAIVEAKTKGIIRGHTLTISLNQRDKDILFEFAKDIGSDRVPYLLKDYGNRPGADE